MYVPDKLKLNKFRLVAIPKPKDYFIRFGRNVPGKPCFTGDDTASMPTSKVDSLASMAAFDAAQQRNEQQMRDYEAWKVSHPECNES